MQKAALIVLDGWGHRTCRKANAISSAATANLTGLMSQYPVATLGASGLDVGLPEGQMGNSEVGHLTLGAGRVVYQDFTRINKSIADASFFGNEALVTAVKSACDSGKALHLMGLVSDGGVHSHQRHLYALLELAKRMGLTDVYIHAFLDGRDTPPKSGLCYIEQLETAIREIGVGRIATVCGRFYAMDRDTRWDRVEKAFRAMCFGNGIQAISGFEAVRQAYDAGHSDEFVLPCVIIDAGGNPAGSIKSGDSAVFFNFRADRARELVRAFIEPDFSGFNANGRPKLANFTTFTEYDETFGLPVAYPQQELTNIFGEVIADQGLKQLRIAETEKYAHVTFFFNGGEERLFPGEERILIPSPRDVETYDQKPEMSAFTVRDRLIEEVRKQTYDFILVNFANLDMVGHTGIMEAAVKAVEAVDACVGDLVRELQAAGYATLITADHGNAEELWDDSTGQPHTAHTLNRVPCIAASDALKGSKMREGGLADVAPTLLDMMGITKPKEMEGRSLLEP